MKKQICSLMAFLLCAGLLASCGDSEQGTVNDTNPAGNTGDVTDSETVDLYSDAPAVEDMEEATLTILNYPEDEMEWCERRILVSGYDSDVLNDALYEREIHVEDLYNCSIEEIYPNTEMEKFINKTTMAGDESYDVAMVFDAGITSVLLKGSLLSWNELELDLSKDWWDSAATEQYNFFGIQAAVTGAYSLYNYSTRHILVYNETMKNELDIEEDLYELVRDGKWTYDKLYEYAAYAVKDMDGNGKMESSVDRYGIMGSVTRTYSALLSGADVKYIDRDNDGNLYFAIPGNNYAQTVISKLVSLNSGNDIYTAGIENEIGDSDPTVFLSGRSLFWVTYVGDAEECRSLDFDIGFLPPPKYDESQENYYSLVEGGAQTVLPKTLQSENYHKVAVIMDALAYYSYKDSVSAYIETLLKEKVARDEDSAEMIQLVFDNSFYDLGTGVWSSETKNQFTKNIFMPKTDNVSSLLAKISSKADNALTKFTDAVYALEE